MLLRPELLLRTELFGLVAELLLMTVAGLAMWKLTSADTLSWKERKLRFDLHIINHYHDVTSSLAIFSLERDFIRLSSDNVFFGSLESGES